MTGSTFSLDATSTTVTQLTIMTGSAVGNGVANGIMIGGDQSGF